MKIFRSIEIFEIFKNNLIIESYKQVVINVKINANIVIRRITVQKIHDTDKYRINKMIYCTYCQIFVKLF